MSNQQMAEKRPSRVGALIAPAREYLRDTAGELRKVKWPTREQVRNLSAVVLAVTLTMSVILGVFDFLFEQMFFGILRSEPSLIAIAMAVVIVVSIIVLVLFSSRER